jgi:hypothetical protein
MISQLNVYIRPMHFLRNIAILLLNCIWLSGIGQMHTGYVENKGQWPSQIVAAKTSGVAQLYLRRDGMRIKLSNYGSIAANHQKGKVFSPEEARITGHVYDMQFIGCTPTSHIEKSNAGLCQYNFFLDEDASRWAPECRSFGEVRLHEIYPGIDFKLYEQDGMTKYDFMLAPGADYRQIRLQYSGMDRISIEHSRIRIDLSQQQVYEQAPIAWQMIEGKKVWVACSYQLVDQQISFSLGHTYDPTYPLIIDPQLVFSTYSGSESDNFGYTATYDEGGNLYSGSSAFGQEYPTTLGAFQITHAGGDSPIEDGIDMALSKYSSDGTTMLWSTFQQ